MRASELGRETRQLLAVRITLTIAMGTGGAGIQSFPVGFGMLDAEDWADLAYAVKEIASVASAPRGDSSAEAVTIDYQAGSVRVGLLQIRGEAVAYIQVGDIALLSERPVWQVPTTLFIAVSELPRLLPALTDVIAKIRAMRISRGTSLGDAAIG